LEKAVAVPSQAGRLRRRELVRVLIGTRRLIARDELERYVRVLQERAY